MEPLVGIIMGSTSDWETMRHAAETLEALGVPHETRVVSAHRTPERLFDYARGAAERVGNGKRGVGDVGHRDARLRDEPQVPEELVLARPRREWPDAMFAANDLTALGLLQSLVVGERMLVPNEIALIGFDDISFAAAAAVPLSTIRHPSRMIGRTALRTLLEESDDPELIARQTVFPPELVVRRSTAPPR